MWGDLKMLDIQKTVDTTLRTELECKVKGELKKLHITKFNHTFVFSDVELPRIEDFVEDEFFKSLFGPVKSGGIDEGLAQSIADAITLMNKGG
jgi:hypothetical protein